MATATEVTASAGSQRACCVAAARDEDATFCNECGRPLVRCMAFDECGSLLNDRGLCQTCVAPHMQIDAGALMAAKVGGAVTLPLSIYNLSPVNRPLFVTGLWTREGNDEWQAARLSWERLDPRQAGSVTVRAEGLNRAGAHGIEILMVVASRWHWREEAYAFNANFTLNVEDEKAASGPVVNISGESVGHGNTVYISDRSTKAEGGSTHAAEPVNLAFARAELDERRIGLRGLDGGVRVSRQAKISWQGFANDDVPRDGIIVTKSGLLTGGRSRAKGAGGDGDIRILIENPDGSLDEDYSRLISRRHFELYIENDRLMVHVTGKTGLRINGDAYGPDKTVVLAHGDLVSPLVEAADRLGLRVQFSQQHGEVVAISLTREPASNLRGAL